MQRCLQRRDSLECNSRDSTAPPCTASTTRPSPPRPRRRRCACSNARGARQRTVRRPPAARRRSGRAWSAGPATSCADGAQPGSRGNHAGGSRVDSSVDAPAAFRHQLLAALPRLRRYAHSLVFDAALADDLAQTTLERALRHWHQFDPTATCWCGCCPSRTTPTSTRTAATAGFAVTDPDDAAAGAGPPGRRPRHRRRPAPGPAGRAAAAQHRAARAAAAGVRRAAQLCRGGRGAAHPGGHGDVARQPRPRGAAAVPGWRHAARDGDCGDCGGTTAAAPGGLTMHGDTPIDDTLLGAWLDGELAEPERQRVEAWLHDHPDDAARVRLWAADAEALRARLGPLADAALPPERCNARVWQRGASPARRRAGRWRRRPRGCWCWGRASAPALAWQRCSPGAVHAAAAAHGGGWVQRAAYAHARLRARAAPRGRGARRRKNTWRAG